MRANHQPILGPAGMTDVRCLLGFLVALFAAVFSFASLASAADPAAKTGAAAKGSTQVERGHYLVQILGCNDCHTPWKMGDNGPEPDMSKMLSGHPAGMNMPAPKMPDMPWAWVGGATMTAFAGPWGISYAPNLTSDEETGLGAWDEQLFIQTIRNGKIKGGGRPIMPPMPWEWYSKMTDADLKAVFAYLKTVPPIKNQAPDYVPPTGGGK